MYYCIFFFILKKIIVYFFIIFFINFINFVFYLFILNLNFNKVNWKVKCMIIMRFLMSIFLCLNEMIFDYFVWWIKYCEMNNVEV